MFVQQSQCVHSSVQAPVRMAGGERPLIANWSSDYVYWFALICRQVCRSPDRGSMHSAVHLPRPSTSRPCTSRTAWIAACDRQCDRVRASLAVGGAEAFCAHKSQNVPTRHIEQIEQIHWTDTLSRHIEHNALNLLATTCCLEAQRVASLFQLWLSASEAASLLTAMIVAVVLLWHWEKKSLCSGRAV